MSSRMRDCPACGTRTADRACPSCGARLVRVLPVLLAGAVPAAPGARVAALAVDLGVAVVLLASTAPTRQGLWPALLLAAVAWSAGVWVARGRSGLTPGNLLIGLRTVDAFTGLPVGVLDVPFTPASHAVVLDVRNGRDPTRTVADDVREALAAAVVAPPCAVPPAPPAAVPPAPPALPAPTRGAAAIASSAGPELPTRVVPHASRVTFAPEGHATPPVRPTRTPDPDASTTLVLVLDDGQRVVLDGVVLLGRNPTPQPNEQVDLLVPLHDLDRTVSKTHARLRRDGATVWLLDRGSTNGTTVTDSTGRTIRATDVEVAVPLGAHVHLGDRSLTLRHEPGDHTVLRPTRRDVPVDRRS